MKPPTRFDVVVRLRERDEDKAKLQLAEAQRQALAAEEALRVARERTKKDERRRGSAADWLLADAAHARALVEERQAETHVHAASQKVSAGRIHLTAQHARAEAVRRLAETRRTEILQDRETRERKMLDEAATIAYSRSAG